LVSEEIVALNIYAFSIDILTGGFLISFSMLLLEDFSPFGFSSFDELAKNYKA